MRRLITLTTATLCLLALGTTSFAQPRDKQDQPTRIDLLVSPAPEPIPALRYSLAIGVRERQPGNAAPFYHRALLFHRSLPESYQKQLQTNWEAWFNAPMTAEKATEMKKWLEAYRSVFDELKTAVYREHCDWELRLQDRKGIDAISFLLPEVQELRGVARALGVRARVDIFEGRFDDAIETLRWTVQLGRDVGRQETLISNLVAIAIVNHVMEPLTEWIGTPNSPNLYWAIATLPQPVIDMRHALEFERGFPEQIFPFLKDAEKAERSPDEWQRLLEQSWADVGKLATNANAQEDSLAWARPLGMAVLLAHWYPTAKAELIRSGLDAEKVEAMPVAQVVAVHASRHLSTTYDNLYKATLLPYEDGLVMMKAVEKEYAGQPSNGPTLLGPQISRLLLPGVLSCKRAEMRLPRHFKVLQTIEAIRMHAAQTGKLPASLREITIVPVPVNPVNQQPFPYLLSGTEAVLEMPIALDEEPAAMAKRFHLRLRPSK